MRSFDFDKKLFIHPERLAALKYGKRPFPVTLEVDLTNACNHKCRFCYERAKSKKSVNKLHTTTVKKRLSEALELGVKGVSFTGGGEPLLHQDFGDILKHANRRGLDCGLMTNGSLISSKNVDLLCEHLQWMRVSMGGGDRETYTQAQGVDHYDRVIENIKMVSDAKKQTGEDLYFGIRVLVTEDNIDSLENLVSNISGLRVDYLQVAPDQFSDDGGEFWHDKHTLATFCSLKSVLENSNIQLLTAGYSLEQDRDTPRMCYAHFYQAAIDSSGNVLFCKNARNQKDFVLGNIHENSLRQIWAGNAVLDLERHISPASCGLFCKNTKLNNTVESVLFPEESVQPNFVN